MRNRWYFDPLTRNLVVSFALLLVVGGAIAITVQLSDEGSDETRGGAKSVARKVDGVDLEKPSTTTTSTTSTQPSSTQPLSTQSSSTQPPSTQPHSTQPTPTQPSSAQPSSTETFTSEHPEDQCQDHPTFTSNCKGIAIAGYCKNKHYAKYCCRSCTLAGNDGNYLE